MSEQTKHYAVTFTTTERLLLNMDVEVVEGATIQDTIGQILKEGIFGDQGAGDPDGRWLIPGSQIAKVSWTTRKGEPPLTGKAADPNGGPGGR